MEQYLILIRGGDEHLSRFSAEQINSHMESWGIWMQQLAKEGNLFSGLPLQKSGVIISKSGNEILEGPFKEGPDYVNGYLIIKAKNIQEAQEISKKCPALELDGTKIEIRQIMKMPG